MAGTSSAHFQNASGRVNPSRRVAVAVTRVGAELAVDGCSSETKIYRSNPLSEPRPT